jgi:hypothetical protein
MPSEYVRAYNARTNVMSAGNQAKASAMQAQASAAFAQAQATLAVGFEQIRSQEFMQAQRLTHQRDMVEDQRRYEKAERERTENERYRRLAFRQAVLAANPGQPIDEGTVEYLWRDFESKQRAEGQARFSTLVNSFRGQLQSVWGSLAPEIDRLKAVRPLTTSRRFLPVAVILAVLTVLLATNGFVTFLGTAAILGVLGHRAITKYREALPDAAADKTDLALVAAGKALPIAAIFAGWSGMIAAASGWGIDDGSLLGGFATIGLAIFALVKRKSYYGMEAQQADLDARIASYQADVAWLDNMNFEDWYAHVLRQPLNLPGTALS